MELRQPKKTNDTPSQEPLVPSGTWSGTWASVDVNTGDITPDITAPNDVYIKTTLGDDGDFGYVHVKEINPETKTVTFIVPESESVLRIGPYPGGEALRVESPYPYPGLLRRIIYRALLGWKWEKPDE